MVLKSSFGTNNAENTSLIQHWKSLYCSGFTPCLTEEQHVILWSTLPSLHCKQAQFLSIPRGTANAQASQHGGTVHSTSHLHPYRERDWASCTVSCSCSSAHEPQPADSTHRSTDLGTPWAEGQKIKIWCVSTWELWNIMCAPHFIWPQAAAARCHRLWDCSSQQQDMALRLQPCSFSCISPSSFSLSLFPVHINTGTY